MSSASQRKIFRTIGFAFAWAVFSIFAGPAVAQTVWIDATGNWFTAANWMAGAPPNTAPPDAMTNAQINNSGTAQVAAAGAQARNLDLGFPASSSGTVSITGVGSLNVVSDFTIGGLGAGTLSITAGGTATGDSSLIGGSSAGGQATVDGAGSTWTNNSLIVVGLTGNGTLDVKNGGAVSSFSGELGDSPGGVGVATVDGAGSKWTMNSVSGELTVGFTGNGTVHITNGGLISDVNGFIGGDTLTSSSDTPVGVVTVDGAGSKWTNSFGLTVGRVGTGTLNITNGGAVSDINALISALAGSIGTVTVDGAGSTWTTLSDLFVGSVSGTATLDVTNGGAVLSASGRITSATVTVDGTGSMWTVGGPLFVGTDGDGTLSITGGGAVSNTDGYIGNEAGIAGTVTVDGTNSKWTNTAGLFVGEDGTGTMHITNGGAVSNLFAQIGSGAGSNGTVTVDGAGSTWTNAGTFIVGSSGTGMMTITNGGAVSSFMSFLGSGTTGDGTVIVDGTGSTWTSTTLYVGGDTMGPKGTGLLRIANFGTVSTGAATVWNTGTLEIGANPILSGTLFFVGGTLRTIANTTFPNTIVLGGSGIIVDSNGFTSTLSGAINGVVGGLTKINPGTIVLTNTNTVPDGTNIYGGVLQVDGSLTSNTVVKTEGTLAGVGTIFGNVDNFGVVSPGDSGPGILHLKFDYTQNANGTLRIEIGGLTMGVESDLLTDMGTASLNGTLRLVRINNFVPHAGDQVIILTAITRTGEFSIVDSSSFNTLLRPEVVYDPTDVRIVFVQGSFAGIGGLTPNQQSVANELDEVVADPRAMNLIEFLDTEPMGNLAHDYDLIAPEELASIYEIGFSQAVIQNNNLQRRMDDIRAGSNGFCANGLAIQTSGKDYSGGKGAEGGKVVLTPDRNVVLTPAPENKWGVFVTGSGDFVNVGDDDSNARGYDITTGDFTIGADYRIGEHFAVGVDGGYAASTADLVDDGRVEVDGGKGGAYATFFGKGFFGGKIHVDGAVGGGWNSYDTRRTALLGTARGSTDGSEFNALLAYGSDWTFGCLSIGTWSTLQYTNVSIDSFTEEGSLAPLHIEDQDEDSLRATTGIRAAYDIKAGRMIIRPELRAAWQHEYNDRAYPIDARFASGAGDVFTVHGPKIGRDAALVGAGVNVQWSRCVSTYVYYDGVLGRDNYDNNAVSGGLRVSF